MKIISLNRASFAFILGVSLHCAALQAHTSESLSSITVQSTVTGTVSDSRGPLPGATVMVKGTSTTTTTDFDGRFSIRASKGDILLFSYIGFASAQKTVEGAVLDITLVEDAAALKEVVINAGYYSVKDKDRTGSIARISSKDIEKQPVTNVLAVMQGRMAGVSITQDSGTPGGGFQIRIRGQNSLRSDGNDPLYIVDGIPFSSQSIGSSQTSGFTPSMTSPLNSIDPSEIASIEVLKDADATAIYGSRGANGVVLITTKKGKSGKMAVSVGASTSFGQVTSTMKLMKTAQYLDMRRQAFANDGLTSYPASAYDINGTWDQNRYTDWQKELIGGTAEIHNFQGTVSGGSDRTQFLLGANYRTETTVLPGDFRYDKGSVKFNMNHGADDDRLKIVFSAAYNAQRNDLPAADLTDISRSLAPNAPALYSADGELNWENGTWTNPLAVLKQEFTSNVYTLTAGTVLSYRLAPGLVLKTNMGYTDIRNRESRTQPSTMYNPSYGLDSRSSSIYLNNTTRQSWIVEPQLDWSRRIGSGELQALAGATFQNQQSERLIQFGSGFSSNSLIYNLASASTHFIYASDKTLYKYQAFFARLNYSWKDRYIVNATARRDGSSRFGPQNQFASFGAVGAAWLFSNEGFLSKSSVLSFGKLRGSYGTTGNDQIGDYQFFNTYAPSGISYDGVIGLQPTRLYNPDFGWETNRKLELALETGFFRDRVYTVLSWYRNRSSNQLVGIPLPGTTGFSSLTANLGATVENSGMEFTLRTINLDNAALSWSTSLNLSVNRNRLIAFPGLESSPYSETYVIGKPLDIRRLYQSTGVDPATGIYTFRDYNGDGQITSLEDRQLITDLTPSFFGGIENQIRYKRLSLDFLFQFVKQKNISYPPGMPGTALNQRADLTNVWQQPGDNAPVQQFTSGADDDALIAFYRYTASNGVLEDASFIRLKNIALSYDLPESISNTARIRLFMQGQNVFTITSFKSGDPELRFGSFLPPLRVFSFGVQASF
jgi:TonB-linked SusC/RagA family outer membrane protein